MLGTETDREDQGRLGPRKRWVIVAVLIVLVMAGLSAAVLAPSKSDLPFLAELKPTKPKGWDIAPTYEPKSWFFGRKRGMALYQGPASKPQIAEWVKLLKADGWMKDRMPPGDIGFSRNMDYLSISLNVVASGFFLGDGWSEWSPENKQGNVVVDISWWDSEGKWQKVKRKLHLGL